MIRFSCPGCQMTLQASPAQAGIIVACPRCKRQMKVPAPVASVAPTPQAPLPEPVRSGVLLREIVPHDDYEDVSGVEELPLGIVQEDSRESLAETSNPIEETSNPPPIATIPQWFYIQNHQKVGPLSLNQLYQLATTGELGRNDMAWRKGMAERILAGSIKELSSIEWSTPPPIPGATLPAMVEANDASAIDVILLDAVEYEVVSQPQSAMLKGLVLKFKGKWQAATNPTKVGVVGGGLVLLLCIVLLPPMLFSGKGKGDGEKGSGKADLAQAPEKKIAGTSKISKMNFDKIVLHPEKAGMTEEEVEGILGQYNSVDVPRTPLGFPCDKIKAWHDEKGNNISIWFYEGRAARSFGWFVGKSDSTETTKGESKDKSDGGTANSTIQAADTQKTVQPPIETKTADNSNKPRITKAQYDSIQIGTCRFAVEDYLGRGEDISPPASDKLNDWRITYKYYGQDGGVAIFYFRGTSSNPPLLRKVDLGLK